ncbi:aspartyl/glutamyl-tRNA amidotransferase subunit A [Halothiobacillus diazotrophicus]|uniref:Glutamyl-tRNA(Gln) amidotransferase subunit A n=1 Tax=Halothiobacillus diazotrophicus TaxID=1860122 RepID=A0A191ZGI9_9GAMM|nr:Asp-tRNA(Asn)/Glu-tRNA(Gln) amidotransferase subunit GatA [Halothiobacillus diazotrophicus]ANJ66972.1 aspartyl/glutamyl-tRNA amidotransferase subunit A [Halothiobacillus diazotrophicus]
MSLYKQSLAELRAGLDDRRFSARELAEAFLARVAAHDGALNSFISRIPEMALAAADAADARIAAGERAPLLGIPYAHKDIFCTQGVRTTCASRMLGDWVAPYDATVHQRLNEAGAVLLGKTNMDEFAMGSSNENSAFGAVKNPWDHAAVPGGSSGGSAAAVAARLVPWATGTDTGGSIRQPAAYCGVTGIKPTYGRVSRFGMIAYASSLDQGGVLAPSAADCAIALRAMAGHDSRDSTSADQPVPDYAAELDRPLTGLRIGVPRQWFTDGLDATVAARIEAAIEILVQQGAVRVDIDLPDAELALAAYYLIAPAEASSNLSRFDGVRFGYRCAEPRDLMDLYERSRSEGFGAEVKRRILIGTYALSAGYYDAFYGRAQRARRQVSENFAAAFAQCDVIAGPVAPTPAFDLGAHASDPATMYLEDIYTIPVNLAGLPGMSVPVGFSGARPVGMQLIGAPFTEARLLNVAHRYQQQTDWHQRVPTAYEEGAA